MIFKNNLRLSQDQYLSHNHIQYHTTFKTLFYISDTKIMYKID